MKQKNRTEHKINGVFEIVYMSSTGTHTEYIQAKYETSVIAYARKEAKQNGATVISVTPSSLPKNLSNDESFTNL